MCIALEGGHADCIIGKTSVALADFAKHAATASNTVFIKPIGRSIRIAPHSSVRHKRLTRAPRKPHTAQYHCNNTRRNVHCMKQDKRLSQGCCAGEAICRWCMNVRIRLASSGNGTTGNMWIMEGVGGRSGLITRSSGCVLMTQRLTDSGRCCHVVESWNWHFS